MIRMLKGCRPNMEHPSQLGMERNHAIRMPEKVCHVNCSQAVCLQLQTKKVAGRWAAAAKEVNCAPWSPSCSRIKTVGVRGCVRVRGVYLSKIMLTMLNHIPHQLRSIRRARGDTPNTRAMVALHSHGVWVGTRASKPGACLIHSSFPT